MGKNHINILTITNNTGHDLQLGTSWFDSGRVADGNAWPATIAANTTAIIQTNEKDGAWTGCSGWVSYNLDSIPSSLFFAFSNPLSGANKIGLGNNDSIWDSMKDEYGGSSAHVAMSDIVTVVGYLINTGGNPNTATWKLRIEEHH